MSVPKKDFSIQGLEAAAVFTQDNPVPHTNGASAFSKPGEKGLAPHSESLGTSREQKLCLQHHWSPLVSPVWILRCQLQTDPVLDGRGRQVVLLVLGRPACMYPTDAPPSWLDILSQIKLLSSPLRCSTSIRWGQL